MNIDSLNLSPEGRAMVQAYPITPEFRVWAEALPPDVYCAPGITGTCAETPTGTVGNSIAAFSHSRIGRIYEGSFSLEHNFAYLMG